MAAIVLTTAECKRYLRIAGSAADTHIAELAEAVESWVCQRLSTAFFSGTASDRTEYLDGGKEYLVPSIWPVNSITSVTDSFTSGATAVTATDYLLYKDRVEYRPSSGARTNWGDGDGRWKVVYKAGYTVSTCPRGLVLAMLALTDRVYKARGGITSQGAGGSNIQLDQLDKGEIANLLGPYSRPWVGM